MKLFQKFYIVLTFIFICCFSSRVFAATNKPEITSPSAILVDNYTGTILYEKNIDQKMYPASITKILTAILTIENCELTDTATASENAIMSLPAGYSIGDIKVGETLTIQNLLEVLLVHSANDAANVLGEHVGGSIEGFADMMNAKAAEIGCKNSHFVNPSGKHDENHYSTARDLALIMQYCMKNPTFRKIDSMRSCSLPATSYSPQRDFVTTVEILTPSTANYNNIYYYPYAIAGKTGFTTEAQNCLASVCKKDDMELTSVILGSGKTENGLSARFLETIDIYNYGFDNYQIKNIHNQNEVIQTINVKNATKETADLDLVLKEDIKVLTNNSEDTNSIQPNITLNENIKAPIQENQVVGTVTYTVDNVNYSTELLASHNVEKTMLNDLIIKIGIAILLIIIIIIIILIIKHDSSKKHAYYDF